MGSGKTTIGRQLASQLGREFRDSDREVEQRTGASVALIFEIEGEEGFRRREKNMIEELTAMRGIVLATGGGAVLDPKNRAHLRSRGFVVYLRAPIDQLYERIYRDPNRPLLQTGQPQQMLRRLIEERDPLYRETADLIIDTHHRTVREVLKEISLTFKNGTGPLRTFRSYRRRFRHRTR